MSNPESKPYGLPNHPTEQERLTEEVRYLGYTIRQKVEDLEHTKELQRRKIAQLAFIRNRQLHPDQEREG